MLNLPSVWLNFSDFGLKLPSVGLNFPEIMHVRPSVKLNFAKIKPNLPSVGLNYYLHKFQTFLETIIPHTEIIISVQKNIKKRLKSVISSLKMKVKRMDQIITKTQLNKKP